MKKEINVIVWKAAKHKMLLDGSQNFQANLTVVNNTQEDICRHMEAEAIDMMEVKIGNKPYAIVFDDDAFSKEPVISAFYEDQDYQSETLFGNLVIAGVPDEEGNLTTLTEEDLQNINQNIGIIIYPDTAEDTVSTYSNVIYYEIE